jgi:hypothetical protein
MQIAVRWETTRGPSPFYGGATLAITPISFIAAMGIHDLEKYPVVNSLTEYPGVAVSCRAASLTWSLSELL